MLSLNNSKFSDSIDLMYPNGLDIRDTTDSANSASYLDLRLEDNNQGKLHIQDYFDFTIVFTTNILNIKQQFGCKI